MIGLEMDKNMTWNTIPKQHSKQHDGSSCGVYVLMVYSCISLNKYQIFHHIKKKMNVNGLIEFNLVQMKSIHLSTYFWLNICQESNCLKKRTKQNGQ